jgi:predicted amidohydrolase
MRTLTVAAIQAQAAPGDVAGNAAHAARWARIAADQGATVVVLPELFLTGYDPPALRASPATTDVAADGGGWVADARLDPLRAAAAERGAALVVGAAVRRPDGRRTCAALVVDRAGRVAAAYDKQHLCGPDEKDLFVPGTRGATLDIDGWRLGLGVCYDGCFPEHARAAAVDGATAYLAPSAYFVGAEQRRDLHCAARALDNGMYVVMAGLTGRCGEGRFSGGSAVYDPEGRPVQRLDDASPAVVVADLHLAEVTRVRQRHGVLDCRVTDLGVRAVTSAL